MVGSYLCISTTKGHVLGAFYNCWLHELFFKRGRCHSWGTDDISLKEQESSPGAGMNLAFERRIHEG